MGFQERMIFNKTATVAGKQRVNETLRGIYDSMISATKASYTAETHECSQDFQFVMDFVVEKLRTIAEIDEERIPSLENIYLSIGDEFKRERATHGAGAEATAFCSANMGLIYLDLDRGSTYLVRDFIHELIHLLCETRAVSRQKHDPRAEAKKEVVYSSQNGFNMIKPGKFNLFNEAITELLACDLVNSLYEENGEDYNFTSGVIGYDSLTIAVGMFISELAKREGISFAEMRQKFYVAYLSGDIAFLRIITKHYGAKMLGEIANLEIGQFRWDTWSESFFRQLDINSRLLKMLINSSKLSTPRHIFDAIEFGFTPQRTNYSSLETKRMIGSYRLHDQYWMTDIPSAWHSRRD